MVAALAVLFSLRIFTRFPSPVLTKFKKENILMTEGKIANYVFRMLLTQGLIYLDQYIK